MFDVSTAAIRELAHRAADGIEVTLFWEPASDRLTVFLADDRSGEHFEIEAPRDAALDVFHHPYAYAAAA